MAVMILTDSRAILQSMGSGRFQQVIQKIDHANGEDPHSVMMNGISRPYEELYSEWMTQWVKRLEPAPSEELLIAARGQHIQRWKIPRDKYPANRQGYLRWREELKKMHAETVSQIMREAGYEEPLIGKTARIILKKNIRDPEAQVVEDALCLVFLEHQFADLAKKEPEEKMVEILRKSWRKMGLKGRTAALELSLPPAEKALIQKALSP